MDVEGSAEWKEEWLITLKASTDPWTPAAHMIPVATAEDSNGYEGGCYYHYHSYCPPHILLDSGKFSSKVQVSMYNKLPGA